MEKNKKWIKVLYIIGAIALVAGAVDPLEGSVVILAGSFLLSLSTYLNHDKNWKIFLGMLVMIGIGVFFLFYFSSFGGFGEGALSWWWGILVLPYPVGWIISIILLIKSVFIKKKKEEIAA